MLPAARHPHNPDAASPARTSRARTEGRRAFTLLELIIVIAIVGTIAALVPAALSGHSRRAKRSATASAVQADLLRTRLFAMEAAARHTLRVDLAGENEEDFRLTIAANDESDPIRARTVRRQGLAITPEPPDPDALVRAAFGSKGRTHERTWWIEAAEGPVGTIWSIRFDPVSGDPRLQREDAD